MATDGVYAADAPVDIDDSLVRAQNGLAAEEQSAEASINALNDTVVALTGAADGVAAAAWTAAGADIQVVNSIISGFPTSFSTNSAQAGAPATIEAFSDNYDHASSPTGVTRSAPLGDGPDFVDAGGGDYHLADTSALIDASSIQNVGSGSSTTDLDGNPRVVVVDHAATPVDLGAYEYQPPAPAGGNPGGGSPGTGGGSPGTGGGSPGTGTGGSPGIGTGGSPGAGSPSTGTPANGSRPTPPSHPAATVKLAPLGRASLTGKRVSLRLSCSGTAACSPIKVTATATTHRHRVTVGTLTAHLAAGHKATLTPALNPTGRALLARTGRLAVTVTVTVGTGTRRLTVETAHVRLT
ncbi:MAG TPA: hypothetical protein VHW96_00580 [Solirubrobacteraceae bacterium]|jgi:hypothetical protein|nr:hypothetical protein [Solirubrobacteraceae bacterium]